jgi:DNA mismatch endonuclease Vsr
VLDKLYCYNVGAIMDRISPEQRRKTMQAIKSKDSKIELKLRKILWQRGFRYRKHYKRIIGHPDIVFVSKKIAIFCDSEFWHGYNWKDKRKEIKSNKKFWISKIERNMERDRFVTKNLKKSGWIVLRFWGNVIDKNINYCVKIIEEKFNQIK